MKLKGAKILIESLINEGVDTVFGYPGGYAIDIFDEIYQAGGRIKQILTCHEQGAAHAADGYARTTGKTGVVIATSGPGATNLVTGIATAYMDSIPLVAITGNVSLSFLGRDSFQEIDIAGVTMPVTKYNYIVKSITELAETVREAFHIASSGRPGPVLIDIPKNVQQDFFEYTPLPPLKTVHKEPNAARLEKAAELINSCTRPLVVIGGGVTGSGACAQVAELCEKADIPAAATMMGLGGIPASHPLFTAMAGMHGHAGVAKTTRECDLLIALGMRFSDRVAGDRTKFAENAKVLHIDIDNAEINKNIRTDAFVVGDVKLVLERLLPQINPVKRPEWLSQVKKNMETLVVKESAMPLNPRNILRAVNKFSPPGQIIATDVGQHQIFAAQTCRFERPRTFLTSGGLGTMGFGMGAAIGAAVGKKERVALITGDGSFHMNMNELVTAVMQQLPIAVFVFNNNTLGMVRQWQKLFYGKRYSSTTLDRPTDYKLLAKAFGADYLEINDNSEVEKVTAAAMRCEKPVIVNCKIFIDENVLPMIPAGKSAADILLELQE